MPRRSHSHDANDGYLVPLPRNAGLKPLDSMREWVRYGNGATNWQRVATLYITHPDFMNSRAFARSLSLNEATLRSHLERGRWIERRDAWHKQYNERVIERVSKSSADYYIASQHWWRGQSLRLKNLLHRSLVENEEPISGMALVKLFELILKLDTQLMVLPTEREADRLNQNKENESTTQIETIRTPKQLLQSLDSLKNEVQDYLTSNDEDGLDDDFIEASFNEVEESDDEDIP